MSRLVALLLAAAVLTGCGGGSGSAEDTSGYIGAEGAGEITILEPDERDPAPTLTGTDLSGEPMTSADWEGKTIVVNVWGPWCPPCRKEMPALQQVWEEYQDRDVQFVGILNRSKSDTAQAFNDKIGVTYPSFEDQGGRLELMFNDSLPTVAVPTTWIIDPQGRVAVRIAVDDLTASTLSGLIDDVS